MAKSLERTIRDLYRDKQQPQIDEQVQLVEGAPEEVELDEAKDPSMVNVIQVMGPTKNAVEGVKAIQRVFKVDEKKAKVLLDKAIRHALGEETELDEISMDVINRYYKMSKQARDKATNSAVATIMRKGDHSKDLKTMDKRTKGIKLAKSRAVARLRGEEVEIEEKTLTPAEKKKREEVAQAIQRDNPDMPMDKKMAIATATAKKVAEETLIEADAIGTLQKAAKSRSPMRIKFDSGTSENIDKQTAEQLLDVHKKLNSSNKKRFEQNLFKSSLDFMKMVDFAVKKAG
jgi:hypothetical protein